MVGGSRLRPYSAVHDFESNLTKRHQIFAIGLYDSLKYDRPMTYLDFHTENKLVRPRFQNKYSTYTYHFRDIVLNYWPRDYYGFHLTEKILLKTRFPKEAFWDAVDPVYEWANVPPPHSNSIKRNITLPTY
jgi:hypothetical protein